MYSYKGEIATIKEMLCLFVKTKTVDASQLSKMDSLIKQSEVDQIKVLNGSAPLNTQRVMFGAIRNVHTSLKCMKEKLKTATFRHENPTTAEQALELIESLNNVALCIDPFTSENTIVTSEENIAKFSRILYRKAKAFGFSEDEKAQFKAAGITISQVKSFINSFDSNLAQELDIQEEVQSAIENNS
jgi:hypothetical protein